MLYGVVWCCILYRVFCCMVLYGVVCCTVLYVVVCCMVLKFFCVVFWDSSGFGRVDFLRRVVGFLGFIFIFFILILGSFLGVVVV